MSEMEVADGVSDRLHEQHGFQQVRNDWREISERSDPTHGQQVARASLLLGHFRVKAVRQGIKTAHVEAGM